MKLTLPAMRGQIGARTYYSCMMPLNVIPKIFTFKDWIEFRPEDREQRILNDKRIPEIAKYILDNEDGFLFSSITASFKSDVTFVPSSSNGDIGHIEIAFDRAEFVINDGQHRAAAIKYALRENPALGDETISVLLFPYENLDRVQQMFSDLNRYVAKTSKSLDILYDKRDPISKVTVLITEIVPVFEGMVEKDTVSLGARSPKLFSLAALYDANQELLRFHTEGQDDEGTINYLANIGAEFWEAVSVAMPSWQLAKDGRIRSIDVRQESIASHSTVLRAIGAAGGELMKARQTDWKTELMKLKEIDWSKGNKDWDGICIVANSVVSNRQARAATKAYIKRHLGLPLTEGEVRALAKPEIERSVAVAVTELAAELEAAGELTTPRSVSTTH